MVNFVETTSPKTLAFRSFRLMFVQRLLLPCAIGFESLARFIRDQSDRQLVFGLEGVEGGDRIGRNADDLGSESGESPLRPGEIEGFPGAAGRVGARINGAPAARSGGGGKGFAIWAPLGQCGARRVLGWTCLYVPSFRRFRGRILDRPNTPPGGGG